MLIGVDLLGCILRWRFFDHAAHLGGALVGMYEHKCLWMIKRGGITMHIFVYCFADFGVMWEPKIFGQSGSMFNNIGISCGQR